MVQTNQKRWNVSQPAAQLQGWFTSEGKRLQNGNNPGKGVGVGTNQTACEKKNFSKKEKGKYLLQTFTFYKYSKYYTDKQSGEVQRK